MVDEECRGVGPIGFPTPMQGMKGVLRGSMLSLAVLATIPRLARLAVAVAVVALLSSLSVLMITSLCVMLVGAFRDIGGVGHGWY